MGKKNGMKRAIIVSDTGASSRTFSYRNGEITLGFTLRTDHKEDLKAFLVCLEVAVEDIKAEIAK